jgi:hypothetical protein
MKMKVIKMAQVNTTSLEETHSSESAKKMSALIQMISMLGKGYFFGSIGQVSNVVD